MSLGTINKWAAQASLLLVLSVRDGAAALPSAPVEGQPDRAHVQDRPPKDPRPVVRGGWLVLQFVPSPGVGAGEEGAHLTLNWQITPLVYSWAIDSRLSRMRYFIVEPPYRNAGALELLVSPEYRGRGFAEERWGGRLGARAYFPLVNRGEYLSTSVGAGAHVFFDDTVGPYLEGGLYTLFGTWGLVMNVSPRSERQVFQASVRLRWF